MRLADRIKSLAKAHGMTIAEVERKTGISNGQIAKWNSRSPKMENVEKVADLFNVSIDSLVGRASSSNKVDLKESPTVLSYGGKPVSDEDMDVIKAILERHNR